MLLHTFINRNNLGQKSDVGGGKVENILAENIEERCRERLKKIAGKEV